MMQRRNHASRRRGGSHEGSAAAARAVAGLAGLLVWAGALAEEGPPRAGVVGEFEAHLSACTQAHGYDPEFTEDLGPRDLGVGEREWRRCAYQGIRMVVVPNSSLPRLFEGVVSEDRGTTDAIGRGQATREERRQRLESRLADLLDTTSRSRSVDPTAPERGFAYDRMTRIDPVEAEYARVILLTLGR